MKHYLSTACLFMLLITPLNLASAATEGTTGNLADDMAKENVNAVIPADQVKIPSAYFSGPKEGDLALEMYRQLLGDGVYKATKFNTNDLSAKATNDDVTLVTFMLAIMSVIGMIVGMVLTGYWFIVGLLKQNIEGEFLGKKWNSYMVPLRTAGAFVGMQPYPAFGGLSFVQVFVLCMILVGVGMGSAVLSAGAKFTYSQPEVSSKRPDYVQYVKNMLDSKICHEFHLSKEAYEGNDFRSRVEAVTLPRNDSALPVQVIKYQRIAIGENGICGDFKYELSNNFSSMYGDVITKEKNALLWAINSNLLSSIEKLWKDLDPVITQNNLNLTSIRSLNDLTPSDIALRISALEAAEANFSKSVNNIVRSEIASQLNTVEQQKFFDMVEQLGFAYAGSLHFPLLARSRVINSTIANFLVQPSLDIGGIFNKFFSFNSYLEDFEKLKMQSDQLVNMWLKGKSTFDFVSATEIIASMQMGGTVQQNMDTLNGATAKYIANFFRDVEGQPDPMSEVAQIGHALEGFGVTLMIVNSAVSGVAESGGGVPLVSSVKGILSPLVQMITTATTIMFGLGVYYAEVLPAIPYIMWQIAIMGYFIYCLCLLYASPLWFAMFAHPDGEDALGKGASGIPMLLTAILRPSLMVMGLFTGMALLKAIGWFIEITYWPTMTAIHSDGGFVVFQFIGKLAIYGLVMGLAIYKANTLTWELPSLVNSMMGLGNTHADFGEGEAHNKTLMVGGLLSSNSSTMISMRGAGAASNKPKKDGDN